MKDFTAHRLHFVTEAQTLIELNEHQGSALRGALFWALRHKFCAFARDRDAVCDTCALVTTCPVATLVSTFAPGHPRGQNRPRPYTIQPPLWNGEGQMGNGKWRMANGDVGEAHAPIRYPPSTGHFIEREDGRGFFHYEPGEMLCFGLTLYADAMALFPYVVLATQAFEHGGLGRKCQQFDGRWRRGTLTVREVWAENPLTGERQPVIREGSQQVQVPDIPVTHGQIRKQGEWRMENGAIRRPPSITFLTPTRLIEKGHLLKPQGFRFRPFFQRLLERLEALSEAFTDTPLDVDFPTLLAAAETVRVVENRLLWEEVRSYSTRRHADSPTSGLVGTVTLQADDWTPFLPWLLWGQFTHVGKDAVKGNGMYRVGGGGWRIEDGELRMEN